MFLNNLSALGWWRHILLRGSQNKEYERTLLDLGTLPLADAGSAGVGQHCASHLVEDVNEAVALDGGADLLTAGGDGEGHLQAHVPPLRYIALSVRLHQTSHAA